MERKTKILLISFTSLLRKFYQTLPLEIVRQTGWKTTILVPPFWKTRRNSDKIYLEKKRADLYTIVVSNPFFNGNSRLALFCRTLKEVLQQFHPDIIDFENTPGSFAAGQLIRQRDRFSSHSKIIFHSQPNTTAGSFSLFRLLEKINLRKTDAIIFKCANPVINQRVGGIFVRTIPAGVNTDVFRPRDLPELHKKINPGGQKTVGFVYSPGTEKFFESLLPFLKSLKCNLLLVGESEQEYNVPARSKKRLPNLTVIPRASHEEIAQYMNCMDILIVPPRGMSGQFNQSEQFLLEGMASGIAVIAPDSEGDILPKNKAVLTYRGKNPEELSKKIKYLLGDPKMCRTLGWKARKKVQEHFSWGKVAAQTVDLYRDVMSATELNLNQ